MKQEYGGRGNTNGNIYRLMVKRLTELEIEKKIPIEVGAACKNKDHKYKYSVRDDSGINMSDENPYYGELTAMYRIWKNTDSPYVGLYHYNKHWCLNG